MDGYHFVRHFCSGGKVHSLYYIEPGEGGVGGVGEGGDKPLVLTLQ